MCDWCPWFFTIIFDAEIWLFQIQVTFLDFFQGETGRRVVELICFYDLWFREIRSAVSINNGTVQTVICIRMLGYISLYPPVCFTTTFEKHDIDKINFWHKSQHPTTYNVMPIIFYIFILYIIFNLCDAVKSPVDVVHRYWAGLRQFRWTRSTSSCNTFKVVWNNCPDCHHCWKFHCKNLKNILRGLLTF